MDHNHCKFLKPRRNFLFSALLALASAAAVSAGEKIRFDDTPQSSVTLPSTVIKNQKVQSLTQGEGPAGQGGGSEPVLDLTPAATPVLVSPKLSELLDKRKNWMFSNPAGDDSSSSSQYDLPAPGGFDSSRAKGEVERYFERANSRKEGEREKQMRPFENADSLNRPFERSESRDRSFNPRWDNKLPSMFGGREENALGRMEPGSQPLLDGPRLPGFGDPFRPSGVSDPINLQQDATRNSLNPIFPAAGASGRKRLDFLNAPVSSPVRTSPTDTLSIQATTTYDRARGIADSLNNPILGASGLNPASSSFRPDPVIRSQPPVFEIPRRKF